ncbi:VF530 family DNA-binding protein [Massilia suwonensis]|uniref:VF530 family DNA-binding protein n=1 Tax=Massilia suwonensis TaxID=648895 RepID=A0ABW0MKK3_9BURK
MPAHTPNVVYKSTESNHRKAPPAMSVQSLHGITLESLLTRLVEHYGWEGLGRRIDINCFQKDPSIKSSLKFLRRTPWAREQVEALYLETRFTN